MLLRLHVQGFKNLVDTEIRFGPLTCIAGPNGVGKSNIFDAIRFLSLLADKPFVEAVQAMRCDDVSDLFTHGGDRRMRFECDLLIPAEGYDAFNQLARTDQTLLTYAIEMSWFDDRDRHRLQLEEETLVAIPQRDMVSRIGFDHGSDWRRSLQHGTVHRAKPFIETDRSESAAEILLHADPVEDENDDKRPSGFPMGQLPRTVLSSAQRADAASTAVLVRNDMRAWRTLHLEPSALRCAATFNGPSYLGDDGSRMPAALYRLAQLDDEARVYAEVANRLAQILDDVDSVRVERDTVRRVYRFVLRDRLGAEFSTTALSDGSLRFLALTVFGLDQEASTVLCLEEPENGIHPERIEAVMNVLIDQAVDPFWPVGQDNPLRQVIFSTHSSVIASHVDRDSLLFADRQNVLVESAAADQANEEGQRSTWINSLVLRPVHQGWRVQNGQTVAARGSVVSYINAYYPRPAEGRDGDRSVSAYESVGGKKPANFEL
ncbi:MAG: AAA family ATPase [Acidobacteriota bacterium]